MILASCNAWAIAIGVDNNTLEKKLKKAGFKRKKKGDLVPFDFVFKLLTPSMSPKDRECTARAIKLERENRLADGEIVEWGLVENLLNERFVLPLTAALDAAPRDVDRDWVEKTLKPVMRAKLEAPKSKEEK